MLLPEVSAKVPEEQDRHEVEPAFKEKVPIEHEVHPLELALEEKVPLGQIEHPQWFTLETPMFGFALYLYPGRQGVHALVFE